MGVKLLLNGARPNFHMIRDNSNFSLGIVDCSLYKRRIALKNDYHKKRMDMLAYFTMEYTYLEILAKFSLFPLDKGSSFKKTLNKAPLFRNATAMNTNTPISESFTENPLWYYRSENLLWIMNDCGNVLWFEGRTLQPNH